MFEKVERFANNYPDVFRVIAVAVIFFLAISGTFTLLLLSK